MISRILACVFGMLFAATVHASGEGDTNGDASIDLDDLNNVRNNFGTTGPVGNTPGDAWPFDGVVDLDDLNGVRNNFGAVAGFLADSAPRPSGDADGDADVDGDDLKSVRDHFDAFGLPDGSLLGDTFPFDGHVDLVDLNNVRNHSTVPEPSPLALLALGAAGIVMGRRRMLRR